MTLDEMRQGMNAFWNSANREAEEFKDPFKALEHLNSMYRSLEAGERELANCVLTEWVRSEEAAKRFDAVALIREHHVTTAIPALLAVIDALEQSTDPGAPFERQKVERLIGELRAGINVLASDIDSAPAVFDVSGSVPSAVVGAWASKQPHPIPADLIALWELIGGGDLFETEELFAPGVDADHEIGEANRQFAASGLSADYLVFHAGLYLTAIDSHGRIVKLDPDSLRLRGGFASIDHWYADLRREYGQKYGLADSDPGCLPAEGSRSLE